MSAPHTTTIQVRFRDIDSMDHVNSAVYVTYLEQARSAFFRDVLDERLDRVDTVIARQEIEYRRPIDLGDAVRVDLEVARLGESSVTMAYEVYANDELAATAESVQVAYDRETERSRPLPTAWRERLSAYDRSE
ncbi:acyl-CoA thioesterase [Halomarina halobia]|uniref:Acyl-CoA thioesterase n=1 Tax=Halomarina halobia TaxID=3033386 RepID=A0ABD6ADR7_9EURY|nr:thioesterase family protein [Halomarina sp. PSR21]